MIKYAFYILTIFLPDFVFPQSSNISSNNSKDTKPIDLYHLSGSPVETSKEIKHIFPVYDAIDHEEHNCFSQNQRWEVYFGLQNRKDWVNDVIETYDKGYFILGGYELGYGVDEWDIKTDLNGTILYEKIVQYIDNIAFRAAAQDSNGNIYVSGVIVVGGQTWPNIVKFDSCGNKQWCRIYVWDGEFTDGWAQDIVIGHTGEVVLLVHLNSIEQNKQEFLFGLDTEGNLLWANAYATKDNYPLIGLTSSRKLYRLNDEYFICGYCYWPFPGNPGHKFLRPFYIGIDSNFNEKWILPFAVSDSIFGIAYSCIALNNTLIMGAGKRRYYGQPTNSLLMFFNTNGDELGFNNIYNEQIGPDIISNVISDVERINDTLFIASASVENYPENYVLSEFVFDTAATLHNLQVRQYIGGSPNLIKTTNNEFLITGDVIINSNDWDILLYKINESLESVAFDTTQQTYDSLCPHQIPSDTINLTDCLIIVDIDEVPTPSEYYAGLGTIPFIMYPNPAKDQINLSFENTEHHNNIQLFCYDIYGRLLHQEEIFSGQSEKELDISSWGRGMYVAVITSNCKFVGKGKFVKN